MTSRETRTAIPQMPSPTDWYDNKHPKTHPGLFREKLAGPMGLVQMRRSMTIVAIIGLLATLVAAVSIFGKL